MICSKIGYPTFPNTINEGIVHLPPNYSDLAFELDKMNKTLEKISENLS